MAVNRWNFPNGNDADTLTTTLANASAVNLAAGTAEIDTAFYISQVATKSARFNKTGSGHFWFAQEGLSSSLLAVDCYVMFHSFPSVDTYIAWIGQSSSARNLGFNYRVSTGDLRVIANGSNLLMTGFVPELDKWYRLSLWLDKTLNVAKAGIFEEHGTTPLQVVGPSSIDINTANPDRIRIGGSAASAASIHELSIGSWAYDTEASDLLPPAYSGGGTDEERSPEDSLALSDSVQVIVISSDDHFVEEELQGTDSVTVAIAKSYKVDDFLFGLDTDSDQVIDTVYNQDDTVSATDAPVQNGIFQRLISDLLPLQDDFTIIFEPGGSDKTRTFDDLLDVSESLDLSIGSTRERIETLDLSDSIDYVLNRIIEINDSLPIQDQADGTFGTLYMISDGLNLSDTFQKNIDAERTIVNVSTLFDSSESNTGIEISIDDDVQLQDSTHASFGLEAIVDDTLEIVDSVDVSRTGVEIFFSESAHLQDSVQKILDRLVIINDSLTLTDTESHYKNEPPLITGIRRLVVVTHETRLEVII